MRMTVNGSKLWNKTVSLAVVFSLMLSMLSGCGRRNENIAEQAGAADTTEDISVSYSETAEAETAYEAYIPGVISDTAEQDLNIGKDNLKAAVETEKTGLTSLKDAITDEDFDRAKEQLEALNELISEADAATEAWLLAEEAAKSEIEQTISEETREIIEERRQEFEEQLSEDQTEAVTLLGEVEIAANEGDWQTALEKTEELEILLYPEAEENIYGNVSEQTETLNVRKAEYLNSDLAEEGAEEASLQEDSLLTLQGSTALSEEIMELTDKLGTPLEVYNYIKNTIKYSNYTGCRKGAIATFDSNSGNDVDQASLLVSMLRYLGYQAGYKTGIIKLTEEAALNLTGASDLKSAANILAAMGTEAALVSVNGVPSYIKFKHTWVSAYIPYTDYRGAGKADGDYIWLDMDTSIKEYEDCTSLYEIFKENFTGYEALEEYFDSGSAESLDSELVYYAENIQEYFDGIYTGENSEEQIMVSAYSRAIKPEYEIYLPLSLQYEVIEDGATDWELLQIKLTPSAWDRITWFLDGDIVPNPFE